MPKFNANLTMLFNEVDFLDRFKAAKDSGFKGVEYLFPYPYPKEDLAERLEANGLTQVLHNLPAGDWAKGERGIACHPDRVGEFQDGVGKAIEYAGALQCTQTRDIPGFFLNRSQQALDIIKDVGSDNLFLQYDIYHMQIMEGNLAPTIERNLGSIRHLQLADNPGRNEPGTGEINYPFLFQFIDKLGYSGWIGCEYKPAKSTLEGLGWVRSYL